MADLSDPERSVLKDVSTELRKAGANEIDWRSPASAKSPHTLNAGS